MKNDYNTNEVEKKKSEEKPKDLNKLIITARELRSMKCGLFATWEEKQYQEKMLEMYAKRFAPENRILFYTAVYAIYNGVLENMAKEAEK